LWIDGFKHAFAEALYPMDQAAAMIEVTAAFLTLYLVMKTFDWIVRRKRINLALRSR